jgi:hypothetical protein
MNQKETQRQFEALWKKLDETSKVASEATILSRHADKGFIELSIDMKNLKGQVERQNNDINSLGEKFDNFIEKVQEKLGNNLKWTIAIIFMLLTAYSALIILAITNQK